MGMDASELTGMGSVQTGAASTTTGGTGGTVITDGVTIQGDGSAGSPIKIDAVQTDATLTGAGTVGSPLHAVATPAGVTSYAGATGALTEVDDPLLPVSVAGTVITRGQLAAASWTTSNPRVYAVDGTVAASGKGFADAASNSAADLATATAAAGAVALKTIEALGAIFPRDGAGRRVAIVIRSGTYTGNLGLLLNGCVNYDRLSIWATDTNATAGSVAFDGSNNSLSYAGGVTVGGLNAAGYNPTGVPTTSMIPMLKVGGAAPGLPAEPAAPLGERLRFDIATKTVALRGAVRPITAVTATTTTSIDTPLSAAPVVDPTEIFYLDKPGVIVPGSRLSVGPNMWVNIVGIDFNGSLDVESGLFTFGFCRCSSFTSQFPAYSNINRIAQTVAGAFGTNVSVGGSLRNEGTWVNAVVGGQRTQVQEGVFVGAAEFLNEVGSIVLTGPSVWAGGIAIQGGYNSVQSIDATDGIGNNSSTLPMRITGPQAAAGLLLRGFRGCIRLVDFQNMGAKPCVLLVGACDVMIANVLTGSTGNTDVGLDLGQSVGSRILLTATPTVTGTAGDVRLADGTIITWAQAAAGVIDSSGNQIISLNKSTKAHYYSLLPDADATRSLGASGKAFAVLWAYTIACLNVAATLNMVTGQGMQLDSNTAGNVSISHQSVNFRFTSDVNGIQFFGAGAPPAGVAQQPGGAATATLVYSATEQGMINRMYTALRNYGLLT